MRQRRGLKVDDQEKVSIFSKVSSVDIFPKPKEDYRREQTAAGSYVSILTISLLATLVLWETVSYIVGRNAYSSELSVDNSSDDEMVVNIDIIFPRTACHSLSVDILDATGTRHFNITSGVFKIPLNHYGNAVFTGTLPNHDEGQVTNNGPQCTKCFLDSDTSRISAKKDRDGGLHSSYCCNTCAEVLAAYSVAGLTPPLLNVVPQCLEQLSVGQPGCRAVGNLKLHKVNAAIVFGPKRSGIRYLLTDVLQFDASHTIERFSFGDSSVLRFSRQKSVFPLQGKKFVSPSFSEIRYFLKVVPTTYSMKRNFSANAKTYEYSAQVSHRAVPIGGTGGAIPGVLFGVDLSPIQVNNFFERPSFGHFIVRLCGIVGGLFVMLSVVDSAVSRIRKWCYDV